MKSGNFKFILVSLIICVCQIIFGEELQLKCDNGVEGGDCDHHYKNRTRRNVLTAPSSGIRSVGTKINIVGAVGGSIIKLLERPGRCCSTVTHDFCGDGTRQKSFQCCGNGRCNVGCCACDDGCRQPPAGSSVAIVFHHRDGKGSNKAFPLKQGECWNMEWFNDKISDVMAVGCVTVWEHHGCTGSSIDILNERVSRLGDHRLRDGVSWDDQISSLSYCSSIFNTLYHG